MTKKPKFLSAIICILIERERPTFLNPVLFASTEVAGFNPVNPATDRTFEKHEVSPAICVEADKTKDYNRRLKI